MARTPSAPDAMAFSVPKDIQNHPVRNVDRARQREMWWSVVFVSLLVGALLLVAWEHSQWTDLGYEMTRLQQRARPPSEAEHRHLRLELETLRAPQRIEALAIRDLQLVAPSQTEAVVLERRAGGGHAAPHARGAAVGTRPGGVDDDEGSRPESVAAHRARPRAAGGGPVRGLGGRHRGAAGLAAGLPSTRRCSRRRRHRRTARTTLEPASRRHRRSARPHPRDERRRGLDLRGSQQRSSTRPTSADAVCWALGDCTRRGARRSSRSACPEEPRLRLPRRQVSLGGCRPRR